MPDGDRGVRGDSGSCWRSVVQRPLFDDGRRRKAVREAIERTAKLRRDQRVLRRRGHKDKYLPRSCERRVNATHRSADATGPTCGRPVTL